MKINAVKRSTKIGWPIRQEIVRRVSANFGADLKDIINLAGVYRISIYHHRLIFTFHLAYIQNFCHLPSTTYCMPSDLTQNHICDISITPSYVASTPFKLLIHNWRAQKCNAQNVSLRILQVQISASNAVTR